MTYERPTAGLRLSELEELELTIEKLVAGGDGLRPFRGHSDLRPALGTGRPGQGAPLRAQDRTTAAPRSWSCSSPGRGDASRPAPTSTAAAAATCSTSRRLCRSGTKSAALLETVRRISGVAVPDPSAVVAGQPWGYRSAHAAPHPGRPRRLRGRLFRSPQPRSRRRRDLRGPGAAAREGARDPGAAAAGTGAVADRSRERRRRAGLLLAARRRVCRTASCAAGSARSSTGSTPGVSSRVMRGCSSSWSRSSSGPRPARPRRISTAGSDSSRCRSRAATRGS